MNCRNPGRHVTVCVFLAGLCVMSEAEIRGIAPDMTHCQVYDLRQYGRLGDVVGLSMATTAWNIGDAPMPWYAIPDENHPFLAQNVFRLKTVDGSERFEQIGQKWCMHGFCALGGAQCGGQCQGPRCSMMGVGCTPTNAAGVQASQNGLGPRFEINPWTRGWTYEGSHLWQGSHDHDPVQHRLQVHDADLDPAQNPGATYYAESYYVCPEDRQTMNNAGWKPVTPSFNTECYPTCPIPPSDCWCFTMSGYGTMPEPGFAIEAWAGATQTLLAQEIPVIEFESPDGRCILAAMATDLGGGTWHYEYALLNVDMDRQVGSFSVPIGPDTTITNVGFHAVEHHDEPFNTTDPDAVAIDNAPWDWEVTDSVVTWSTTSNPLRWGTVYNFRFDADDDPETTTVTVGLFRPGEPETLGGITVGPHPQPQSLASFADFQSCFSGGADAGPGCDRFDYEADGSVDLNDYHSFLTTLVGP